MISYNVTLFHIFMIIKYIKYQMHVMHPNPIFLNSHQSTEKHQVCKIILMV